MKGVICHGTVWGKSVPGRRALQREGAGSQCDKTWVGEREPVEKGAGNVVRTRSWESSVMTWFSFLNITWGSECRRDYRSWRTKKGIGRINRETGKKWWSFVPGWNWQWQIWGILWKKPNKTCLWIGCEEKREIKEYLSLFFFFFLPEYWYHSMRWGRRDEIGRSSRWALG